MEPCSVGSHLLFLKVLDRLPPRQRWWQTTVFAGVRAAAMAALGVLAAWLGSRFLGVQHGLWAALGSLYVVLGVVYVGGGAGWLIRASDRLLPRISTHGAGATLGAVFALNIPACAAPLLAVLLGGAAAQAAAGGGIAYGAGLLAVFGLALSSPLLLAVFTKPGRRVLDTIARWSSHMPRVTGLVLIALGLWSIGLAIA
ncbi:cytochrome c biogenesis protein CcdA [Salinisphaera sp. PC39]|uniref:cytochrome c biogenesis protein CcdA n=1 Tax=Salinisphaera sp. PC39 TaxID=1304156 RepID=UPI0033420AAC